MMKRKLILLIIVLYMCIDFALFLLKVHSGIHYWVFFGYGICEIAESLIRKDGTIYFSLAITVISAILLLLAMLVSKVILF